MAEKKSDRSAVDGRVFIKQANGRALVLTLNCETDFVAQNQGFIDCAEAILATAWSDGIEKAKEASSALINDAVLKTGENIQLGSIDEYTGETIGSYIHFSGKTAALVVMTGGTTELAKDVAMHITAMKPTYLANTDIKESDRDAVIEVLKKEVDESDKPEEIKAKMLEGKIASYFKEQTLLDQPFFKQPEITIGSLIASSGATVTTFRLYTLG